MNYSSIRLLSLTQGNFVPSTRFRFRQHVSLMESNGFEVKELMARFNAYPPTSKIMRPTWFIAALINSYLRSIESQKFDICFLQRNLISTLITFERILKKPLIFDVDDAIHLAQRNRSIEKIASISDLIICGNSYLADYYSNFSRNVTILPTAVNDEIFTPRPIHKDSENKVIGWSGTAAGGFKYLYAIEPALARVMKRHPSTRLKIISDHEPTFSLIANDRIQFIRWSPDNEATELHDFDIGIMPIFDDEYSRGKCSFKMLTYMASAVPVVVSHIGMNIEVIEKGECGFSAKSLSDWEEAIDALLINSTLRNQCGETGRKIIENHYSTKIIGKQLIELMRSICAS